jgi:hypothetical protein
MLRTSERIEAVMAARPAPPHNPAEEDDVKRRRLTHTIRQIERICSRCWAVSTQTEDGRRFTGFGVTRQQAVYRAHHKARAYGRYAYPTMPPVAS